LVYLNFFILLIVKKKTDLTETENFGLMENDIVSNRVIGILMINYIRLEVESVLFNLKLSADKNWVKIIQFFEKYNVQKNSNSTF
jgi:hypothetical protein